MFPASWTLTTSTSESRALHAVGPPRVAVEAGDPQPAAVGELLLEEQREDGLAGLPAGAVIRGAELPRVDPGLPKTFPGEVFAQWIEPANLALLDERDRTIVLVLAFCGFRV